MDGRYWRKQHVEWEDFLDAHHGEHRHKKEATEQFSYPPAELGDALRALYGKEVAEPELAWLADLLENLLRFEGGVIVETYLDRVPKSVERTAAEKLLRVLYAIDEVMLEKMPKRKYRELSRAWQQISLALHLPSSRRQQLTEAGIGRQFGVCEMAVSRSITKLLRLAEIKPNGRGYNGMNAFH